MISQLLAKFDPPDLSSIHVRHNRWLNGCALYVEEKRKGIRLFQSQSIFCKINNQFHVNPFPESSYSERYMGSPLDTDNYPSYSSSSLLGGRVRWMRGRDFFLAHGTADRNVHFQHGMLLARELVNHGIRFKQQVCVMGELRNFLFK